MQTAATVAESSTLSLRERQMPLRPQDRDARLVRRFLDGDAQAFDELVARHRRHIYNLAYQMTADREWAEDIAADVLLEAYQSLPRFQGRSSFSSWLYRITVNVCLEHVRRRKASRRVREVPLEGNELASGVDVVEVVMTRAVAEKITRAIWALPPAQRAATVMYHVEGRSYDEIGRILGVPRNTARSRVFHGTRLLRRKLESDGLILPVGPSGEV